MKLLFIFPGEPRLFSGKSREEQLQLRKEVLISFASPGTDIEVSWAKGAQGMRHGRDIALVVPNALEIATQGEKDGFDAVILHGI